jgi:hypothetical protein
MTAIVFDPSPMVSSLPDVARIVVASVLTVNVQL